MISHTRSDCFACCDVTMYLCAPQFLLIAALAAVAAAQHGNSYGHDDYDAKTP